MPTDRNSYIRMAYKRPLAGRRERKLSWVFLVLVCAGVLVRRNEGGQVQGKAGSWIAGGREFQVLGVGGKRKPAHHGRDAGRRQ